MVKNQPKMNQLLIIILNEFKVNRATVVSKPVARQICQIAQMNGVKLDGLEWLTSPANEVSHNHERAETGCD